MKTEMQNSPQIKIRFTQIRPNSNPSSSRLPSRSWRLCGYSPAFHLCSSVFYLWLILFFASAATAAHSTGPTLSPKSDINQILDALDARGKNLSDFSAKVQLADTDPVIGDSTIHTGTVLVQRLGPPGQSDDARIRVTLNQEQKDNKIKDYNHVYTLDKGVLDERDYIAKKETTRQILKPGEKLDLFKLGEGPFPLPIGQKKEDVLKSFDVQKIPPDPTDPPSTVHLQLTPKDGTQLARLFKTIDVWVDQTNTMPRRIQTEDLSQSSQRTTDLTDVKINTGVTDKDFAQPQVSDKWDVVVEPYGQ
jgi:outer membrane lipoprotein-sorting protein